MGRLRDLRYISAVTSMTPSSLPQDDKPLCMGSLELGTCLIHPPCSSFDGSTLGWTKLSSKNVDLVALYWCGVGSYHSFHTSLF